MSDFVAKIPKGIKETYEAETGKKAYFWFRYFDGPDGMGETTNPTDEYVSWLEKYCDNPQHVGTWVLAISDGELMKWGKDGDTIFPFPPDDKDAILTAKHLLKSKIHRYDTIYILRVFNNGQMKQFFFSEANL